ncbi:MAG: zf-HC2 domain-containing protein [Anaerolineaceae bacterium]|nr:MAG: zf-HC2 domain-containing protein [Anaerolineaceae bacterium]
MHIEEGTLRAFVDGELSKTEEIRVQDHLRTCAQCEAAVNETAERAERVHRHMTILDSSADVPSTRIIRQRLQTRIDKKETSMLGRLFRREYRLAWTTAAVVVVIAISMLFPQVQVLAGRLLSLFRVEQIQPIEISLTLGMLPDYMEGYFGSLEVLLGDQIDMEKLVEPVEVQDASEASKLAGFTVRLPTEKESEPHIFYIAASTIQYEIEHELLQSLLIEIGRGDIVIPESVDGKQVTIHLPDIVMAMYGECGLEGDEDQPSTGERETCMALVQARSPTVDVPPELDLNSLGEIFLQVLGMSDQEAARFSEKVDWLTTLVLPIPADAQYEEIADVDGAPGILVKDPYGKDMARFTLVWIKSGILHGLMGIDDPSHALIVADSLK